MCYIRDRNIPLPEGIRFMPLEFKGLAPPLQAFDMRLHLTDPHGYGLCSQWKA